MDNNYIRFQLMSLSLLLQSVLHLHLHRHSESSEYTVLYTRRCRAKLNQLLFHHNYKHNLSNNREWTIIDIRFESLFNNVSQSAIEHYCGVNRAICTRLTPTADSILKICTGFHEKGQGSEEELKFKL